MYDFNRFIAFFLRSNYQFIVLLSVITTMNLRPQSGFLLLIVVPCSGLYLWIRRKKIMTLLDYVSWVWLLMLVIVMHLVVLIIHLDQSQKARYHANMVLNKIQHYHQQYQQYPKKIQEVDINPKELPYDIAYRNFVKPVLFYPATFMPYRSFIFDFDKQKWHFSD